MNDVLVRAGMMPELDRIKGMTEACIRETVDAHDARSWNYCWLTPWMGLLMWVDHREPSKRVTDGKKEPSAEWKTYNRWHWTRHASVVDHDPANLVKDHVRWYVDENTNLIDLRFYFQLPSGLVYVTSPNVRFYELERDFFKKHGLCSYRNGKELGFNLKQIERMIRDSYNMKGLAPYIPADKIMMNMVPTPQISLSVLAHNLRKQNVTPRIRSKTRSSNMTSRRRKYK